MVYLLFFLLWIVFNGQFTLEIALFGLVIAAAMLLFVCKFMGYSLKTEYLVLRMSGYFLRYMVVLFVEIVKANWCVIKWIFVAKKDIQPALVSFQSPVKSKWAKILLADSITLTPGTITVSLEGDTFTVHCLDRDLGVGIDDSIFVTLLLQMEEAVAKISGVKAKQKEDV